MSHVTKRQVSRWFVSGKGYATGKQAYRAVAKRLMWELVTQGKTHLLYAEDDHKERRALVDGWYGRLFPHTGSAKCRKMCRQNSFNGSYTFKSCKAAQEEWLDKKVAELEVEDAN